MDAWNFPAGTTYAELLAAVVKADGGRLTIDDEWREPTAADIATYRAEVRDYVRRRRNGLLYYDEEPPIRPVAHYVRTFTYSR